MTHDGLFPVTICDLCPFKFRPISWQFQQFHLRGVNPLSWGAREGQHRTHKPLRNSFPSSWQFLADLKAPLRSPLFNSPFLLWSTMWAAMPVWCQQWHELKQREELWALNLPLGLAFSSCPQIFAVWNPLQKCKFPEPGLSTKRDLSSLRAALQGFPAVTRVQKSSGLSSDQLWDLRWCPSRLSSASPCPVLRQRIALLPLEQCGNTESPAGVSRTFWDVKIIIDFYWHCFTYTTLSSLSVCLIPVVGLWKWICENEYVS